MPGPMTHLMYYKALKQQLIKSGINIDKDFDKYIIFSQGHDLLLYQNHYNIFQEKKLTSNIELAKKIQEYQFVEFVYTYLKNAEKCGLLNHASIRYFIGPGYISHHILDMYTHPLIIYYAGDHIRTKDMKRWEHGIAENLIDIYVFHKWTPHNARFYPVHKYFKNGSKIFDDELINILNMTFKDVYQYDKAGESFAKGGKYIYWFMRNFKYDKYGIKKHIFNLADSIFRGVNSFSYNRDFTEVSKYINSKNEVWHNPMDHSIVSNKSFDELFSEAVRHTSKILVELEKIYASGTVRKEDIERIIPNRASTHGLECGQELKIVCTKNSK